MTDARLFTEVFMTKGKILDRPLPSYTWRQEAFNSISHAFGVAFGVLTLALCVGKSIAHGSLVGTVSSVIYGVSMILVYLVSALYHGAKIGKGEKDTAYMRSLHDIPAHRRHIYPYNALLPVQCESHVGNDVACAAMALCGCRNSA